MGKFDCAESGEGRSWEKFSVGGGAVRWCFQGAEVAVTQGHEWPDLEVGAHSMFTADGQHQCIGAPVSGWNHKAWWERQGAWTGTWHRGQESERAGKNPESLPLWVTLNQVSYLSEPQFSQLGKKIFWRISLQFNVIKLVKQLICLEL